MRSRDIDRDVLQTLRRRSDAKGLAHLSMHGLLLASAGALCVHFQQSWLYWPCAFALGVVLVALFAPAHECVHFTAFDSRWLNRSVASICGLVLCLPPAFFRAFHLEHHRYTQDLVRDPELSGMPLDSPLAYAWRVTGIPYWLERVQTTLKVAGGESPGEYVSPAALPGLVSEARQYLLAYLVLLSVSFWAGEAALFWFWLVPVLLAQPLLRLYLMAEHTGCPLVRDMLANSRTTHTNWLLKLLAWNMPYHAEHHAYAAVPFHALPALHNLLAGNLKCTSNGYIEVHRRLWEVLHQR